jgi:SAM-dependent methyltransferase
MDSTGSNKIDRFCRAKNNSLNIGCGGTKKYPFRNLGCAVNCDVQKPEGKIDNFICCDASHLPFRAKTFSRVLALHLIEHLTSPSTFLEECARVTKGYVEIITPNIYCENSFKDKSHIHHFNVSTLANLLEKFFEKVSVIGEGGFWIPIRGNTFAFRLLHPLASRFTFLAINLCAICCNN